jgi:hypothetical protein
MLNARLSQKTETKHIGRCNKVMVPEAKKNRKEKTIHKRKKKQLMNVDLENMKLLRQQLECRKFYKGINIT